MLDELWDFADAAGSEERLRAAAAGETDAARRAELETQLARALGLQDRFAEADAVLDGIAAIAAVPVDGLTSVAGTPALSARLALERGRVRNSAGQPDAAMPLFQEAARIAASAGLVFLQVDALHMLAIADPARADEWTSAAFQALAETDDGRTLRWNVSLHNNRGWSRFYAGSLGEALAEFERSRDAAARWGTPQQLQCADEAIAETRAAIDPAGR